MHASPMLQSLLDQLNTVIVGKPLQIQDCVACLLAGGHLLIEDVPGVGKTTLAQTLLKRAESGRYFNWDYDADRRAALKQQWLGEDRLLVFDVKEGWEPLCRFLGVPVPEGVPFPRLNDAAEFKARIRKIQLVQSAALVTLVTGVYLIARSLLRRVR